MGKRILILGGNGHVGSAITHELSKNHQLILVVQKIDPKLPQNVQQLVVDLNDSAQVTDLIIKHKFDLVIYGIGLIREFPQQDITFEKTQFAYPALIIDALVKHSPQTVFSYISANGVDADYTPYQQTKLRLEKYLQSSGLKYVIWRPSLIVGNSGKYEFVRELKGLIKWRFAVQINLGNQMFAPVSRLQLAQMFVALAAGSVTLNTIYHVGGVPISWRQMQQVIAGKWLIPMPAPALILKCMGYLFRYQRWFPLTDHQVIMLQQGNVVKENKIWDMINLIPKSFNQIWDDEYKGKL